MKELGNSVTKDHAKDVCLLGRGHDCCRYLVCGPQGFECSKHSEMREYIDKRVAQKTFTARGDNCDGLPANGQ